MAMSLEDRVRRIEDREAIRALASRYSLAIDDHDFETLQAIFTDDARYGRSGAEPTVGGPAIAASLRSIMGDTGPSFHVNHDHFIDFDPADPDSARGLVTCHAETSHGGRHTVAAIRYSDRYRRENGTWKFTHRELGFLYFVPCAEYPGILLDSGRMRAGPTPVPANWPAWDRRK